MAITILEIKGQSYNYSVDHYIHHRERLVINPPFQRGLVWTAEQKQNFMEALIGKRPIPPVFINRFPSGSIPFRKGYDEIVVDGQQRLSAIFEFVDNKLEVQAELWGDQTIAWKRGFGMSLFPCVLTEFSTMKQCAELYAILLTSGTAHTPEEIAAGLEFVKTSDW